MKAKRWAAFGLAVSLTACLTAAGKRVVVTKDREVVGACRLLGRVKSGAEDTAYGRAFGSAAEEGNENGMVLKQWAEAPCYRPQPRGCGALLA
jgi:hypothetical protein